MQVAIDSIAQVSDAQFTALSSSVSQLSGRVDSLFDLSTTINRDAQRGIASIAAQANPHFPSAAGKTSYASNVATYRGEVGFSAGLMHRFQGDFAITAGVTYAGGNSTSIKAGVAGEF
ncbi:MAG: YadA-like family protein [Erythrobacter sp.]